MQQMKPQCTGYRSTPELIAGIKKIAPFEVSVSFYPERHPDSPSHGHDIELLKAKMDAGASRALGQFCFDNDLTARFRDDAARAGITIPIVPGVMPTTNFNGVARMHERVRKDYWGYAKDEHFSNDQLIKEAYRGIRPAPGYPAQPEHSEKATLFKLLDAEAKIGVKLTESYAMPV